MNAIDLVGAIGIALYCGGAAVLFLLFLKEK